MVAYLETEQHTIQHKLYGMAHILRAPFANKQTEKDKQKLTRTQVHTQTLNGSCVLRGMQN